MFYTSSDRSSVLIFSLKLLTQTSTCLAAKLVVVKRVIALQSKCYVLLNVISLQSKRYVLLNVI